MEKALNYLLAQADKVTAWIGFIGIALLLLNLTSFLALLFLALIILPQDSFSKTFAQWASNLREKKEE